MGTLAPCSCPHSSNFVSLWHFGLSICVAACFSALWLVLFSNPACHGLLKMCRPSFLSRLLTTLRQPPLEPKAFEIFKQRHLGRCVTFANIVAKYLVPVAVANSLKNTAFHSLLYSTPLPVSQYLADFCSLVVVGIYLIVVMLERRRPLVLAAYEVVNAAVFLLFIILPFLVDTEDVFQVNSQLGQLVTLCMSLYILDQRLMVMLNLISFASQLLIILLTPTLRMSAGRYAVFVAASCTMNYVVSSSTRSNHLSEADAIFRERCASRSEAVVQSLLSGMCDAVLALKEDLTIRDACPRLASLLLRPDLSRPPGADRFFTRYLAEDDVPRFQAFIEAKEAGADPARSIRVHLLDSVNTRVQVEIFHARMKDLDNNLYHVLGVVEDTDKEEKPGAAASAQRTPRDSMSPTMSDAESSESGSGSGSDSHGSAGSRRGTPTSLASWGHIGEAVLTIRTRLTWEIVEESDASRTFFSFSSDPDGFIQRFDDPYMLLRWFEFIHTVAVCGQLDHPKLKYGPIRFFNPSVGSDYQGRLTGKIRRVPEGADKPFNLALQTVETELHFEAPPKRSRRPSRTFSVNPLGPLVAVAEAGGRSRIRL